MRHILKGLSFKQPIEISGSYLKALLFLVPVFFISTSCASGPQKQSAVSETTQTLKTRLPYVVSLKREEKGIKRVIGEGSASIYNGNVEKARLVALRAAYADAVKSGCGIEIGSLTLIKNVKTIADTIISRSGGLITSYRIIKEGIDKDDATKYNILIEAIVKQPSQLTKEEDGLKLLLELLNNPTVLIIIPEREILNEVYKVKSKRETEAEIRRQTENLAYFRINDFLEKSLYLKEEISEAEAKGEILRNTETALAKAFSEYGYGIITSDDLVTHENEETFRRAKLGNTSAGLSIAKEIGADVLLIGIAHTAKYGNWEDEQNVVASIALSGKAILVSQGKFIKAIQYTEKNTSTDILTSYTNCLNTIANKSAKNLSFKIAESLLEEGRETKVTISNINFDTAKKVKDVILKIHGVEDVRFTQVPMDNRISQFLVITSFVPLQPEEIKNICFENLGLNLKLDNVSKFEMEYSLVN